MSAALGRFARKAWQRARALLPAETFYFDRPLLLFQSDDWGRVGLRDRATLDRLRTAGLDLGKRPYDFYGMETAEDLFALREVLNRHQDAMGRPACLGMNFVVHNPNFAPMEAENFRRMHLLPLSDGLPRGWDRPGLLEAYREGIRDGVFRPALHGSTHFCRSAVETVAAHADKRTELLNLLWREGVPYIYWRMPWIGYEYWNPNTDEFLTEETQRELIGVSVGAFAKLFSELPRSACAPGYRSDVNTHRAWAEYGIRVAQNGPGGQCAPHFDRNELLHCYRTVDFEPAVDTEFSVAQAVRRAEASFERGSPAIVSMHAINLQSSIKDFRSGTLAALDEFLGVLTARHKEILFLNDDDLYELVQYGRYESRQGPVKVNVTKKRQFSAAASPTPIE